MSFDEDLCLERDDSNCHMIRASDSSKTGCRLISVDKRGPCPLVVFYEMENDGGFITEEIKTFDLNGVSKCGCFYLENIKEEVTAYVVAYRHKSNGEIAFSIKQSEIKARNVAQELRNMGHRVIGKKKVLIKEGVFES